ncbi:TPA: 50S ribosomal protein L31 [Candidatus Delongbacteria bacterium]|nr:50S ribosomal protein L31 [Candidatus Delongbacteria bacterium]
MKKGIHPKYETAMISCVCGNSFESRTTIGEIKVEICSKCHPFYTGKTRILDTAGRVDKFMKKYKIEKKEEKE